MTRNEAYLGCLKFYLGEYLINHHKPAREAYRLARYHAATYVFRCATRNL
jgi:hypothetical protein